MSDTAISMSSPLISLAFNWNRHLRCYSLIAFQTFIILTLSFLRANELSLTLALISSRSLAIVLFTTFTNLMLISDIRLIINLIDPLHQSPTPLGCGTVAVHGMLVPLPSLHVSEDVGGSLVECGHLRRGTIGKLHITKVALSSLDILGCSYQIVTSYACNAISKWTDLLASITMCAYLSSSFDTSISGKVCHFPTDSVNCLNA